MHLSQYGVASTQATPIRQLLRSFELDFREGVDINLGAEYVDEKTIPVTSLVEAMRAVAGDPTKYRQAFNYGDPAGSANLIESLQHFLTRIRVGGLDANSIARKRMAVGACGATSILDALTVLVEPGLVVTSDPMYYIYADVLERRGFEILAVPEDSEGISLALLDRKLREIQGGVGRIAFFYVMTVNDPTCTVLSNARRRALYELAASLSAQQGRAIPIIYDLAYELLLHDPKAEPLMSVLPEDDLGIAYEIGTLSKVVAPALRIGYLLGPDGPLMNALVQKTNDFGMSPSVFLQEMASYLLEYHMAEQLTAVRTAYRDRALAVRAGIEGSLGPILEDCVGGDAGFFYYLTFRDIETHLDSPFFRFLTRTTGEPRVMYVPGECCVHRQGELVERGRRQLRLSYGFEEAPSILRALTLMREAAKHVRC
jgi:DNA-binding transcriptional MocR family regulator